MKPKFYRKVLKNGMTLIFEKRDLPIVSVAFAVKSGGANETENEKGISHFIEHMLYKGTPTRNTKQITKEIEKNGGELNGFTGETITAYWCKMPSKHLDVALTVLSDIVKNPLFDKEELEKERKVIFEEIKMVKDNPRIHTFEEIQKSLYEKPLGTGITGTYKTLNSISREKMVEKFEQFYQPDNMILCVVGDADFDNLIKFAEKAFGNKKAKVPKIKIEKKNESRIEKRKGIDQANLVFAYHTPLADDEKNYAARLLSVLMAEGLSSRLFSEIRDKRNLAYTIHGNSSVSKDFAYNFIYAGVLKENVELVKQLILEEFKKVSESLDEKELKQVKEQMIGNHHISMEESQTQMANLLFYEMEGSASNFYDFEKNIRNVKLKDVKDLAKIKNYSFFALVPE